VLRSSFKTGYLFGAVVVSGHQVVVEEDVVDVHPQVGGDDPHNRPVQPFRCVRFLVKPETNEKNKLKTILNNRQFYIF